VKTLFINSDSSRDWAMKKIIMSLFTVALLGGMPTANATPPEQTESVYGVVTGELVVACDGFDVLNDNEWEFQETSFFDKSGEVVRVQVVGSFHETVYYNSENPEIRLMGGPVDKYHFRDNGQGLWVQMDHEYMLKLPGGGGVFMNAARLIFDANTWELISVAGRFDYGDQDAIDRLCAALEGP